MNKTILPVLVLLFFIVSGFFCQDLLYAGEGRKRISETSHDFSDASDVEAEITFGRELAARILGNYPLLKDEKINKYINLVGKGVALYGGRPELQYHFGVLDTDEINAFATPGGYIFITKGALLKMEDEAQLAAVLGHEIGHIVQKHVVTELKIKGSKGSADGGLASIIGGSTGSFRVALDQALDKAADIIINKGYKVEDEIEADRAGILFSYMAGYDTLALKRFLKKIKGFEKEDKAYKGEHPIHEVRIQKIDDTLKESGLLHVKNAKVKERFYANIKN